MGDLAAAAEVEVRLEPRRWGAAGHEKVLVVTSLGFAWEEDLGALLIEPVSACCGEELLGLPETNKLMGCSSCGEASRFRLEDVRKLKFTYKRLYEWIERYTDPLTPLVLTRPLFAHLSDFRRDAVLRLGGSKALIVDEEEAWMKLEDICEAYSGRV